MPSSSPPGYTSIIAPNSPPPVSTHHSNASAYTLATIQGNAPPSSSSSPRSATMSLTSEREPLLAPASPSLTPTYGAAPAHHSSHSTRKLLFNAAAKMAALFILSTLVLGGTLWLALPTLEEDDRPLLRVPKSFAQLQDLNMLLKKYRDIYPYRIVICYVTTYLFLQAFSLPGSMYLSILGGAVWGVPIALPLACTCVASGATLCYLISAALGPAILTLPKWKARLDVWSAKLAAQRENMLSYLIVLRIAPFPPHWVVNVLAPHLGIGILPFWFSTFLGILGVSVIHTTIGGGLDDMTSAEDFHLISWKNFLGLSAVVVGVLIPVGIRFVFKRKTGISLDGDENSLEGGLGVVDENGDTVLAQGPMIGMSKGKKPSGSQQLILLSDSEDEDEMLEEDEEDEILEAGPVLVPVKGKGLETASASEGQADPASKGLGWRDISL